MKTKRKLVFLNNFFIVLINGSLFYSFSSLVICYAGVLGYDFSKNKQGAIANDEANSMKFIF